MLTPSTAGLTQSSAVAVTLTGASPLTTIYTNVVSITQALPASPTDGQMYILIASGVGGVTVSGSISGSATTINIPIGQQRTFIYSNSLATWMASLSSSAVTTGQTVRNIATHCRHNFQTGNSLFFMFSRTLHINRGDSVTWVQPVFANWYASANGEGPGLGAMTLTASVEYPIGSTPVQVTWNGVASVSIAANAQVIADRCPITIPKGAAFAVRNYMASPSGVIFCVPNLNYTLNGGETCVTSTTAMTDYTTTSTIPSGNQNLGFCPIAILGMSAVPSVLALGDSRNAGYQDGANYNIGLFGVGEICRSLDSFLPYCNVGVSGETAATFVSSHTLRAAMQTFHTHVTCEYGINDVIAGTSANTIQGYLASIYGYFPTKRVIQSTMSPYTNSSDSWATVANQTVGSPNAVRVSVNTWIRGLPAPLVAILDTTTIVEDGTSGKWKGTDSVPLGSITGPCSPDGIHCTPYAYALIQKSGIVNPALFN